MATARRGYWLRIGVALGIGLVGLLAIPTVPPRTMSAWLAWAVIGGLAGLAAGPGRSWLVAPATVGAFLVVASWAGLLHDLRPFWIPATILAAGVFTAGFLLGGRLRWRSPAERDARSASRSRRWRLAVGASASAAVLVVGGLAGYGFLVGADDYLSGQPRETACETPGSRFGWHYEAVNYDLADDARLIASASDLRRCASQGSPPGSEVVAPDGVRLAGWYVPAASGVGPSGATVVLVHGGKSNKSAMLAYGEPLHADFNLLFVDLRNSGRSDAAASTGGLHERFDLRAMLDWLERSKGPSWIAVVGNSNGAATAVAAAADDPRIRALVLDSMHASVETQIGNVAETERSLPAWPGVWALVAGVSARLGEDLASVDPNVSIARLADHPIPLLLTHGLVDVVDRPTDSLEPNIRAAIDAGLPLEVRTCPTAGHGRVVEVCAREWASWVTSFLSTHAPTIEE